MELLVVGLNHKTAPIEIRECLAFPEDKIEDALDKVHALPSLKENMIVSTCNRVEVYAASIYPFPSARSIILPFIVISPLRL